MQRSGIGRKQPQSMKLGESLSLCCIFHILANPKPPTLAIEVFGNIPIKIVTHLVECHVVVCRGMLRLWLQFNGMVAVARIGKLVQLCHSRLHNSHCAISVVMCTLVQRRWRKMTSPLLLWSVPKAFKIPWRVSPRVEKWDVLGESSGSLIRCQSEIECNIGRWFIPCWDVFSHCLFDKFTFVNTASIGKWIVYIRVFRALLFVHSTRDMRHPRMDNLPKWPYLDIWHLCMRWRKQTRVYMA